MADLLALPDDETTVIARAEGASLTEIWRDPIGHPTPFTPTEELRALHRIQVHEDGWVSVIDAGVRFYRLVLDSWFTVFRTASLPGLRAHAVAMRAGVAYIGGTGHGPRGEREVLFVSDGALEGKVGFRPVEVPDTLRWHDGKGVDALLFDGDRLIAVDNVYEPLYFLVYDVANPLAPRLVRKVDFEHPGSGEEVITAALGPCLATLTCAYGRTGVHLYERDTFIKFAYLDLDADDASSIRALTFTGNHLYVAAGARGVGRVDVVEAQAEHREQRERLRAYEHARWPLCLTPSFLPAPSGGPVRFVTKGRGGLYLHTPGRGGAKSEWLPIEGG